MSFTSKILRIFMPLMLGYFITCFFRTVMAIFGPYVAQDLHITPTTMGLATSLFFLGYALIQIPTGVLSDHYGPKKTQCGLFCIAGIGSIIFGLSTGPIALILGRFLIGCGLAGSLLIAFTANRIWFEARKLPILNSLTFSIGSLGAILSSVPTELLLRVMSWQQISIWIGIITIILAFLILISLPNPKLRETHITLRDQIMGLKVIYRNRYFWKMAPISVASLGVLFSIQSYWISPWLRHSINADPSTISFYLLILAIALVFSMPISGLIHHIFSKYSANIEWISGIGVALSIVIQVLIVLKIFPGSYALWALFGIFSFFPMLLYTSLLMHFPSKCSGRANAGINLLIFAGTFVLEYFFGLIATTSIVLAFWVYIILQLLSLIWFCFGKAGHHA